MKKGILFLVMFCVTIVSYAGKYTGTYSFNKGLNKANATIYVNHYKDDSAFIYITAVSGMPDFNTLDFRGFIAIYDNVATYTFKNNCSIQFQFLGNNLTITEDSLCHLQCSLAAKYKKTSPVLKKSSVMVSDYVEKQGVIKTDMVEVYKIPLLESELALTLSKETPVKMIDEYKQFYLIELKNKQNEFLWVLKKNIQIIK
jgi:hypothetical protein